MSGPEWLVPSAGGAFVLGASWTLGKESVQAATWLMRFTVERGTDGVAWTANKFSDAVSRLYDDHWGAYQLARNETAGALEAHESAGVLPPWMKVVSADGGDTSLQVALDKMANEPPIVRAAVELAAKLQADTSGNSAAFVKEFAKSRVGKGPPKNPLPIGVVLQAQKTVTDVDSSEVRQVFVDLLNAAMDGDGEPEPELMRWSMDQLKTFTPSMAFALAHYGQRQCYLQLQLLDAETKAFERGNEDLKLFGLIAETVGRVAKTDSALECLFDSPHGQTWAIVAAYGHLRHPWFMLLTPKGERLLRAFTPDRPVSSLFLTEEEFGAFLVKRNGLKAGARITLGVRAGPPDLV